MCNMSRLGLQQEQQVSISLRLLVVWEYTFLYVGRVFQMAGYLILLRIVSGILVGVQSGSAGLTSSSAMRF